MICNFADWKEGFMLTRNKTSNFGKKLFKYSKHGIFELEMQAMKGLGDNV
jgi:hypothetical protein